MIDLAFESLITLTQAAKIRPASRGGRPTHPSTLYRWSTRGVRGVRLEVIRLGSVTYTSREALQRFGVKLTLETSGPPPSVQSKGTDAALDELGI